jgi:hypothetical protein
MRLTRGTHFLMFYPLQLEYLGSYVVFNSAIFEFFGIVMWKYSILLLLNAFPSSVLALEAQFQCCVQF